MQGERAINIWGFTDAQFTMDPFWGGRSSSLYRALRIRKIDQAMKGSAYTSVESCFIICLSSCSAQRKTPVQFTAIAFWNCNNSVSKVCVEGTRTPAKS